MLGVLNTENKNQKRFAETKKIPTFAVPTKREQLNGCSEAENKIETLKFSRERKGRLRPLKLKEKRKTRKYNRQPRGHVEKFIKEMSFYKTRRRGKQVQVQST
ncbi:hypothetical protein CLV32_4733 [Pedobacter duraquae]|uniref:Uncharacterized protein n=1 Tax=Pedobacter duraquae TaxID=425511 RepID=A0A4R6IBQ9_9SPHI|nr:hypothetical protein CLV32_4733 [Pedobacter duraquae]